MRRGACACVAAVALAVAGVQAALASGGPPIANAGADRVVEKSSAAGAQVILDGSRSSDPEGDRLLYRWTWPGGSATGANPTVKLPLGLTIVTLVVEDGTTAPVADTVVIGVVRPAPRLLKQVVVDYLAAELPTGDKWLDAHIAAAVQNVLRGLAERCWADDRRLAPTEGRQVFRQAGEAIAELQQILGSPGADAALRAIVQAAVGDLVAADEALALTALREAAAAGNGPNAGRETQKARQLADRAMAEADDGRPCEAIHGFLNAWQHAQKALGTTQDEEIEKQATAAAPPRCPPWADGRP